MNLSDTDAVTMILVGITLGALLIFSGVTIGVVVGRRNAGRRHTERIRAEELLDLIGGLSQWTQVVAGEVNQFETRLRGSLQGLPSDNETQGGNDSTWLRELLRSNEQLRSRLVEAEQRLADRAKEVESYLSEARTDALTGLANRRAFDDELGRRFAQWQRYGTPLSIAVIDIDHFKRFNDTWGHQAGDHVLRSVTMELVRCVRESDLLFRFGGEEMALILPSVSLDAAVTAVLRFCDVVRNTKVVYDRQELHVTVSIGVAQATDGDSPASLVRRADEAMYAAKKAGRDRVFYHDGQQAVAISEGVVRLAEASRAAMPLRFESLGGDSSTSLIEITRH